MNERLFFLAASLALCVPAAAADAPAAGKEKPAADFNADPLIVRDLREKKLSDEEIEAVLAEAAKRPGGILRPNVDAIMKERREAREREERIDRRERNQGPDRSRR